MAVSADYETAAVFAASVFLIPTITSKIEKAQEFFLAQVGSLIRVVGPPLVLELAEFESGDRCHVYA
jgi:hypothetical protein